MVVPTKSEVFSAERRKELLQRLNRIEGQVRGLKEMVEEDRRCMEILQQVASVYEALRGTSRLVMRNYLENCATAAIRTGDPEEAELVYEELLEMIAKFAR